MTDLPIELWHLIFNRLQLVDLSSCAQVNKKFNILVKSYRIREIAFTRGVYKWFHYTTPTIDHKHRVDYSLTSILRRSSLNFDHLKRLKIGRYSSIDLDVINRFVHLEELDIDLANYKNEENWTLSLPNLKVLYLFVPDDFSCVELDTLRLTKVCTFSLRKLEFIYPESVRCLHTLDHSGKLSMFRNLEYLTFTDSYNRLDFPHIPQSFDQFGIRALKKLKEIHFYYVYIYYRNKNLSNFKRMTAKLLAMGQPNLKVFWLNVQVTYPNLLTEYERSMETVGSVIVFQLQHYEMLREKDHFFFRYDFNGSMEKFSIARFNVRSEEFTSKFFSTYSFRKIEVIGQVRERELLLDLIARSPNLFYLEFKDSDLDQSFSDQMADAVRLNAIPLRKLQVENTSGKLLSFKFLSKLRHLEWFKTDQELSSGLIGKLLGLPSLVEIECSSGGISKRVERLSTNRFRLNGETLSLQGLLEHFPAKSKISESEASKCRLM